MNNSKVSMLLRSTHRLNKSPVQRREGASRTFSLVSISLLMLFVILSAMLYSANYASASRGLRITVSTKPQPESIRSDKATKNDRIFSKAGLGLLAPIYEPLRPVSSLAFLLPQAQASETISTFAADCTTPQTEFNLGDTVCAKVTDSPGGGQFFSWVNVSNFQVQQTQIVNSSQDDTFALPSTPTSNVGNELANNRGTWKISAVGIDDYSARAIAFITVRGQTAAADLAVYKFSSNGQSQFNQSSGNVNFDISIVNSGPDAAQNVVLTDVTPANMTFVSLSENAGGSGFSCTGSVCTLASLPNGARANFTAVYDVNASNSSSSLTANVDSDTADPNESDNNSAGEVGVSDPTAPPAACTLGCNENIVVSNTPGQAGANVTFSAPSTSSSACNPVTCSAVSGSFFSVGTTVVTCEAATDDSCSFTVTVNDTEDPVIGNCPANITANESPTGSGSATVNYATPSATDNSGIVSVNCDQPSGSSFSVSGSPHTVTCTATDDAGRTDSCSFQVTVDAGGNCTLTAVANVTATSDANQCGTNVTFTDPVSDGSGTCGPITCDHPSGSFFPVGTTPVTCSDNTGGSTSFTVTVNDAVDPVPDLASLPSLSEECTVTAGVPRTIQTPSGPIVVIEVPTATDNCGGVIGGSTNDPRTYDEPGTYTVVWTYTDAAGNDTQQSQTVTVEADTTDPVITACATNKTLTAGPSCAVMPDLTAEIDAGDNCTTVVVTQSPAAGTTLASGVTQVTFTATDNGGRTDTCTATVTVVDNTPPTITAPADASYQCASEVPAASGSQATAADNCGPAPTVAVTESSTGAGSSASPLVITRVYTATDGAGLTASDSQTITVIDNTAPSVTAPAPTTGSADASCMSTIPNVVAGASASDNCTAVPVALTQSPAAGTAVGLGTHSIVITATDAAGNTNTASTSYTVNDTTPPALTCPSNIVVSLPANSTAVSMPVSFPAPITSDNCSTPTVATSVASGSVFPVGTTTVNVTSTDAAGNQSSCSFTVTVLYNFTGFFQPVDNLPTLNSVNAGRAIPVKFSLSGNKGLNIFAVGSPYTIGLDCGTGASVDVEETLTAGSSSLTYNSSSDQYHYVWKTESSWANTCRQLVVTLNDGSEHRANFKFR